MEIRAITDDEVGRFRAALIATFGGDPDTDPQGDERFRALVAPGRAFAAFDRDQVVATGAGYAMQLAVPGGSMAMAGLTMVTVRPTHRRRGLLRGLIAAHLDDARRRGEPISGLFASEATIYRRFGYGVASEADHLTADASTVTIDDRLGFDDAELIDDDAALRLLPPLYAQAQAQRPGLIERSEPWWRSRRILDRPDLRGSASTRRHLVVRRAGEVVGYVSFRQKLAWVDNVAAGSVDVEEQVALDPRAEATLWRFLTTVDLFPRLTFWNAPVDGLLPHLAADPRRVVRRRIDGLWLRPDDIGATLSARRYRDGGALRLQVGEPSEPVFELVSDGGAARCARVDAAPELRLDRAALGSIFLGGFTPSLLAAAGRIVGAPGALARADRMFATEAAPWCAEIF